MFLLEPVQLAHQLVEFAVGDLGRVEDVVAVVVMIDLGTQLLDTAFRVRELGLHVVMHGHDLPWHPRAADRRRGARLGGQMARRAATTRTTGTNIRTSRVLRDRAGRRRTAEPSVPIRAVNLRGARPRRGALRRVTTAGGAAHAHSGRRAISAVPCTRRRGGRSSTWRRSRTRPGDTSTDGSGCPHGGGKRVGGGIVSATCQLAPYGWVWSVSATSTASRGTPSEVDGSTATFLITPCSATSPFSPRTTSTPPSMRRNGNVAVSRTVPSSRRPSQRSVRS